MRPNDESVTNLQGASAPEAPTFQAPTLSLGSLAPREDTTTPADEHKPVNEGMPSLSLGQLSATSAQQPPALESDFYISELDSIAPVDAEIDPQKTNPSIAEPEPSSAFGFAKKPRAVIEDSAPSLDEGLSDEASEGRLFKFLKSKTRRVAANGEGQVDSSKKRFGAHRLKALFQPSRASSSSLDEDNSDNDIREEQPPARHSAFQRALAKAVPTIYKLPSLDESSYAKKRGPVSRRITGALPIALELESGNFVYFKVTRDSLELAEEFELDKAASFSSLDRRFLVDEGTSHVQATDVILSDGISEDVRVVNMAKLLGSVHGTSLERINESTMALGPGLLLLEVALKKIERPERAHVVCLLLKDSKSPRSLAILYQRDQLGEMDSPQISVNPSNFGFTLAQFQSSRGLPSDVPVIQLTNDDLMDAVSEFRLYPQEGMWNGIPISRIVWGLATLTIGAAIVSSSYAAMLHFQVSSLQTQAAQLRNKSQALDSKNELLIASSLTQYGKIQSIDIDEVYNRAALIWKPRTIMTMTSTAQEQRYSIAMAMAGGGFFNNKPSVLQQIQSENVEQLLKLTPPDGCTKHMPGVSGGVNVIQITITCENFIGSLSRYRLD